MTYDKVIETETAQAQKSQKLLDSAELSLLPLQPATEDDSVLTIFWETTLIKYFVSFTTKTNSKKILFQLLTATL